MNLEQVKALSNEELRIKAAELDGFTDIKVMEGPIPALMDLVEEDLFGIKDGQRRWVPDYPNDIAAALKLAESLPRMWSFTRLPGADVWEVQFIDQVPIESIEDESLARAIIFAYVLVMTQEAE